MAQTADIPAWIAFFLGLYSLAAAVGEFRAPGTWRVMLKDMERSAGLRYLTGMFCLVLGAAIRWRASSALASAARAWSGVGSG